MMYADNQFKWVIVVNRKVPIPKVLNAIGHLALAMPTQCKVEAAGYFHSYEGPDGNLMSSISNWPVIVLQANNSNQLRTLRDAAIAASLPCQAFVDTMIGHSAEDQMQKTKTTNHNTVEYFAVMVFGESDRDLRPLTKKFSLFAQPPTDTHSHGFQTVDPD